MFNCYYQRKIRILFEYRILPEESKLLKFMVQSTKWSSNRLIFLLWAHRCVQIFLKRVISCHFHFLKRLKRNEIKSKQNNKRQKNYYYKSWLSWPRAVEDQFYGKIIALSSFFLYKSLGWQYHRELSYRYTSSLVSSLSSKSSKSSFINYLWYSWTNN